MISFPLVNTSIFVYLDTSAAFFVIFSLTVVSDLLEFIIYTTQFYAVFMLFTSIFVIIKRSIFIKDLFRIFPNIIRQFSQFFNFLILRSVLFELINTYNILRIIFQYHFLLNNKFINFLIPCTKLK